MYAITQAEYTYPTSLIGNTCYLDLAEAIDLDLDLDLDEDFDRADPESDP